MRKVFISYAEQNKRVIDQLVEHLRKLRYDPWTDSLLDGGQDWWEEILQRIADCDIFIPIISREALSSKPCQLEFDWTERLGKPVLPVAVEPPPKALPRRYSMRQYVDYSDPESLDAALDLGGSLAELPLAPPLPVPLPEPPAAPLSYLNVLTDLVSHPDLNLDQQRQILDQLETAVRSFDPRERQGGRDILDTLGRRRDLYAAVDRAITLLRSLSDQFTPGLDKTLRVSDIDSGKPTDGPLAGHTDWVTSVPSEFFWDDLLGHIREHQLVPVVGPDVTVVKVGNAEQTLTALIGQRLAERYDLPASPGMTTMDEAVAALLRERGRDEADQLYRAINDIIMDLDPAPGDALRNLAAIEDVRLFVSMTPDRLLAKAVNEVRFRGKTMTRELAFSPYRSSIGQSGFVQAAAPTDTVVLNLFGQADPTPQYAIHEEDRLEWLHTLLSEPASLPDWLSDPLMQHPMLFIGCEVPDWMGRFLLRMWSNDRLSLDRKQFFVVGSPASHEPSLSNFFATFCDKAQVQQLQMEPTEFVAELRARWEAAEGARPPAAVAATGPPDPDAPTIFISYIREDADAARRLCDAITGLGGDVWLNEQRLLPGDEGEPEILTAIRRTVRLFIPIVSANTERAEEGYIFREWAEAVNRSSSIMGRRFIVPVSVDDDFDGDPSRYRQVPDAFRDYQFGRAPAGDPDAALLGALSSEIRAMRRTEAAV